LARSSRPRRRQRGSLTAEAILDAAERVAAAGFDALTIRAVAAELQAAPMALYRYFATKDDLVDALLNRVLGRFEPELATDDWLADLGSLADQHRRMLMEHPWAIVPLFTHPTPGLNSVRVGEVMLGALFRGGITGEAAVVTFSAILGLNYGWTAFTAARRDARSDRALRDILAALPSNEFPLTVGVADSMAGYGSDEHYDGALHQLLAGIRATVPAAAEQRANRR
jgi:AcrR family transcriptional regulator